MCRKSAMRGGRICCPSPIIPPLPSNCTKHCATNLKHRLTAFFWDSTFVSHSRQRGCRCCACDLASSRTMGRKPNPLILEYFIRGPKLNDNSNRYPHTCKQCGENFPKGRIDSLATHITKRCPAISDSERMRACLELHGITNPRANVGQMNQSVNSSDPAQTTAHIPELPQGWSALETLAEASRQVDLNENSRSQAGQAESLLSPSSPVAAEVGTDRFELQEQFTLDNPPIGFDGRPYNGRKG